MTPIEALQRIVAMGVRNPRDVGAQAARGVAEQAIEGMGHADPGGDRVAPGDYFGAWVTGRPLPDKTDKREGTMILTSNDGRNTVTVEALEDSVRVSLEDRESRAIVLECGDGCVGAWVYGPGMVERAAMYQEADGGVIIAVDGKPYQLARLASLLEAGPPAAFDAGDAVP